MQKIFETRKFSDGQVTSKLILGGNLFITARCSSYEELFKVASIKDAWDNSNLHRNERISELRITCLIGQRSDRRFNNNESFDLKTISKFINSMGFSHVKILHPHSSVALALIENSEAIDHFEYVEESFHSLEDPILVSPDAGAFKSTYDIAQKLGADLVASNKVRVEGKPVIQVQGDVEGKECLIVDDMADGGRTFIELAKALKSQGASSVNLYVTHGMFNFGFDEFEDIIECIFTTNSYRSFDDATYPFSMQLHTYKIADLIE